jgi:hypothetical protein
MQDTKPERLAAIAELPSDVQDFCLLDWKTVAAIIGAKDVEHARDIVINAGVPLVHVSERRKLPRWGSLRKFIKDRERLP